MEASQDVINRIGETQIIDTLSDRFKRIIDAVPEVVARKSCIVFPQAL